MCCIFILFSHTLRMQGIPPYQTGGSEDSHALSHRSLIHAFVMEVMFTEVALLAFGLRSGLEDKNSSRQRYYEDLDGVGVAPRGSKAANWPKVFLTPAFPLP